MSAGVNGPSPSVSTRTDVPHSGAEDSRIDSCNTYSGSTERNLSRRNKPKSDASIIVILRKILLVSKMTRTSSGERLGIVVVVDMAVEFGFLGGRLLY